jgi:transposase
MNREDLERLTKPELIDLLLGLQRPDKTSRTSSKPPSTDRKARREGARPGGAKPGHKGHARILAETPDVREDHRPTHCRHCGLPFAEDEVGAVIGEYDEIDLPEVKPVIKRHRRLKCRCATCGKTSAAPCRSRAARKRWVMTVGERCDPRAAFGNPAPRIPLHERTADHGINWARSSQPSSVI